MKKFKIHLIAAARPNFMKIAPLYHALSKAPQAETAIVHTGQHYDLNMSDVFFSDLGLPEPHIHLGVGSGTHAEQTGKVMIAYEKVLQETQPDLVIVVGDVNSTIACTMAAVKTTYSTKLKAESSKLKAQSNPGNATNTINARRPLVAHLEAGLRSNDRTMPEEINRLLTDTISDILWTPSPDADENLEKEGVSLEKIERVGNIMIDSLEMVRSKIENEETWRKYGLEKGRYTVVTLHRPSNVDDLEMLKNLCGKLVKIADRLPLIFPVHPRTRKHIKKAKLNGQLNSAKNLLLTEPLSYRKFMNLVFNCGLAITDSGGIQEETSYLGIPCLTLRPNTERPITTTHGTNQLCTADTLIEKVDEILFGPKRIKCSIDLWDGQTAPRVVQSIKKILDV